MTDPFALVDEPAPFVAPSRAHIHPERHGQQPFDAALLGRVGRGKVKIRLGAGSVFAVSRARLFRTDKQRGMARERLSEAEIDALPWHGAGPDPLLAALEAR